MRDKDTPLDEVYGGARAPGKSDAVYAEIEAMLRREGLLPPAPSTRDHAPILDAEVRVDGQVDEDLTASLRAMVAAPLGHDHLAAFGVASGAFCRRFFTLPHGATLELLVGGRSTPWGAIALRDLRNSDPDDPSAEEWANTAPWGAALYFLRGYSPEHSLEPGAPCPITRWPRLDDGRLPQHTADRPGRLNVCERCKDNPFRGRRARKERP